jgi:hypothetical protein
MSSFLKILDKVKQSMKNSVPDNRKGMNTVHTFEDILFGKLLLHFTQFKSCLRFETWYNNLSNNAKLNIKSLFDVDDLPTPNYITYVLDKVDPYLLYNIFKSMIISIFNKKQFKDNYELTIGGTGNYVLYAIDGTDTISSQKIHCENCYQATSQTGVTTFSHKLVVPAIVSTKQGIGNIHLFPIPMVNINKDKQSSEHSGFASFLNINIDFFKIAKNHHTPILLFDDLYLHKPQVEMLNDQNLLFIGTCKDGSHKYINEMHLPQKEQKISFSKSPLKMQSDVDFKLDRPYKIHNVKGLQPIKTSISWSNNIPIRYEKDQSNNLDINYVSVEIFDPNMAEYIYPKLIKKLKKIKEWKNISLETYEEFKKIYIKSKEKVIKDLIEEAEASCHFKMAFGTNIKIDNNNVFDIIKLGRTRWHIENNSFRTLKLSNFNFGRSYGHGKESMADITSIYQLLVYNIFILGFLFDIEFRNYVSKYSSMDEAIINLVSLIKKYVIDSEEKLKYFIKHEDDFTSHIIRPPPELEASDCPIIVNINGKNYIEIIRPTGMTDDEVAVGIVFENRKKKKSRAD